ncbi:hypothetical protein CPB83DRAFT_853064 [Crepidotus variabilis]|uniref:THO1-MOS11 C-terminal domain-containing protein n=1 Tax=Crepidotus variabilis TaxID=179855 RepID=A0A9P6EGS9_9AGAR|nr:hypothetical protein CPB83DRAFT_853064 [Crepidotus variabilis]
MSTEKLKALKVVDLKQILTKANVAAPAKANKNDLIAKIQSSKEALEAYAKLYPTDDLLAPPEEVDWNVEQSEPAADPLEAAPVAPAVASTSEGLATPASSVQPTTLTADEEAEKRKKRAERFGIPVVEQKVPKAKESKSAPGKGNPVASTEAMQKRAARFGLPTVVDKSANANAANSKKRVAPAAEVDPEELERRKKRAERFGI